MVDTKVSTTPRNKTNRVAFLNSLKLFTRYASFLRWLLPDSMWRTRWLTLAILATGFLGVTFQVQVFAMIIYYARHFSSGEIISLAGRTLDPRSSTGLLAGGSLAVAVLLILSALCVYFSRRSILRMGREYEEFCSKRVFYLLGLNTDVFSATDETAIGDSYLFRLVKSDSRFAGRVLRMLLSLIIPGITLAVAVAVLFYLEASLTLIIAILACVFLLYQYRVSKEAAGHSIRFEKLAPAAGREYKGLIEHFKQQSTPDESRGQVELAFARGPVKKQLDAYEGRLRAVEKSRLVSGLFMALVLGLIMLIMGASIIREGAGWGRLLIYVVALRFAMTNLQNSFAIMTSVNRFYPQVHRYFLFVQSLRHDDQTEYPVPEQYELQVGKCPIVGSEDRLVVGRGGRLAFVTPLKLNRYTLAVVTKGMLGEDEQTFKGALYSMRFATTGHSSPGMSLRRALGLNAKAQWDDLKSWFPDEELWQLAREKLPESEDKEISPKTWDTVEPKIKFALSLISALNSDCRWALIDAKALSLLDVEYAKFYLDLLREKIVVLVFNENLFRIGAYGEDAVAVVGEEALLGLGSPAWFLTVRGEVEETLGLSSGKKKRKAGIEEDEEEPEDDM